MTQDETREERLALLELALKDMREMLDMQFASQAKCTEALRRELLLRLEGHSREQDLVKESMDLQMQKERVELERRLDALNHIKEVTSSFLPRPEYMLHHESLASKISSIELWRANKTGSESRSQMIAIAAIAISIIVAILSAIHKGTP